MARPQSLAFRSLDAHVIDGRADEIAVRDGRSQRTVAQLLHDSASFAGGLRALGIGAEDTLSIGSDVSGVVTTVALMAAVRLQVDVRRDEQTARFALQGESARLRVGDDEYEWTAVRDAGRTDPVAAERVDPDGYAEAVAQHWPHHVDALVNGRVIEGG